MKNNRINSKYGESKSSLQSKISDLDIQLRKIENDSQINIKRPEQKKVLVQNSVERPNNTTPILLNMEMVEQMIENRAKAAVNKAAMAVLNINIEDATMNSFNDRFKFEEEPPKLEVKASVFRVYSKKTLTPSEILHSITDHDLKMSDTVIEKYLRLSKITGQLSALNRYLRKDSVLYNAAFINLDDSVTVINETTFIINEPYFSKEEKFELKSLYEQMFVRKEEIQKEYNLVYSDFLTFLQNKQDEVDNENAKLRMEHSKKEKDYNLRYKEAYTKFQAEQEQLEIEKNKRLIEAKKAKIKTDLA